jgi:prepilin-type processing-associated H-X9-DG protein
VREAANRIQCANNLKQLALACFQYTRNHPDRLLPPGGNSVPQNNWWNGNKGSWLIYTLPYMEQGALYRQLRNIDTPYFNTLDDALSRGVLPARLPYARCPSDNYDASAYVSNYVGSLGPQCSIGPCGYDPNQNYCDPRGIWYGVPLGDWGYGRSPDQGNSTDPSEIRGLFNRLGARFRFPRDIPDGTSNTILLGESLPGSHDHLAQNMWWDFDGGNSHCTTIIPINYLMPEQVDRTRTKCQLTDWNWNISWGFKSRHASGANFAFADGSVHFLTQGINHKTYQLLGCRNDGMPIGSWE